MAFSTAGGGPSRPEMNVTPMIDVLLVLIIIFLVVNQSMQQTGVDAQIPQPPTKDSTQPPRVDRTIVIQVVWGADGHSAAFKVNQETIAFEDLEPRLHDIFKARAEKVAFVKGGDDVDFEYVAKVIGAAREAGVDRVGLLTHD